MKPLYLQAVLSSLPVLSAAESTSIVGPQVGGNALGAGIFFTYILSALYLTGHLTLNLVQRFSASDVPLNQLRDLAGQLERSRGGGEVINERVDHKIARQDAKRKCWARYFIGLALISFTLLSYNMLAFLVVFYLKWSEQYVGLVFVDLSSIRTGQCFVNIWKWATNCNLFRNFAEDLIKHPKTWNVVQLALLYSYTWNMWMGTIGYERKIRHLGTYFLLDQILPVSFTQTLFCATIMLDRTQPQALRTSKSSGLVKSMVTILYVVILSSMSATVGTPLFFPAIFSLRVMLFAPYFLGQEGLYISSKLGSGGLHSTRRTNMWCMLILTGYSLFLVLRAQVVSGGEREPVEINYAADTLRHDYVVGVISSISFFIAIK